MIHIPPKMGMMMICLKDPITVAWVTRPERLKGAKDKVKRPEGLPAKSQGPEGP